MKKIERKQKWSIALNEFAIGLNSGMAGHKTAHVRGWSPRTGYYSGTVNYYDSGAALTSSLQGRTYLNELKNKYSIDCSIKSRGYLKICTIHSDEDIFGYINIKRKRGSSLNISIPVKGENFIFKWDLK